MNATVLVLVLVSIAVLAAIVVLLARARRQVRLEEPTQAPEAEVAEAPPQPAVAEPSSSAEPAAEPEPEPEATEVEAGSYRGRLGRSRGIFGALRGLRGRRGLDAEATAELEDALLRSDVGVATTDALLAAVRAGAESGGEEDLLGLLRTELLATLSTAADGSAVDRRLRRSAQAGRVPVWLFVGVNGVGKTTTIGKLAARESAGGARLVLAAGDTFRAAAADQLGLWAQRSGADLVRGAEGGDPSSVVFDAVAAAKARGADLVLADTAGRLHTKVNLIEELKKIRRVADREPGEVVEVLLVLDATTGQNGIAQARQFGEAVDATGVVLTKLDGTARGGVVVAIQRELGLPVKLVGLGEQAGDLVDFDPEAFVDALLEP